jgi:hypothetical protein
VDRGREVALAGDDEPEAKRDLVMEVTGTAYLDDEGDPRHWGAHTPLIRPSDLFCAYVQIARAFVDLARRGGTGAEGHWHGADEALAQHHCVVRKWPGRVATISAASVRAAIHVRRGLLAMALHDLAPGAPRTRFSPRAELGGGGAQRLSSPTSRGLTGPHGRADRTGPAATGASIPSEGLP